MFLSYESIKLNNKLQNRIVQKKLNLRFFLRNSKILRSKLQ